MPRRLLIRLCLAALAALVVATPAFGTSPAEKKQRVDARRAQLQQRIASARQREASLTAQINATNTQIAALQQRVGDVSQRLAPLEQDLALHRRRLATLDRLFRVETRRFRYLKRQHQIAVHRLGLRMINLYESGRPGILDVVLGSANLDDLVSQVEITHEIAAQDTEILRAVTRSRNELRAERKHTQHTRKSVAAATHQVAVQATQVERLRSSLVAQQNALASARAQKQQSAGALHEAVQQMLQESQQLAAVSSALEAKIQSSGGHGRGTPPSSGFIWPVNGPITSPFGWRCFKGVCALHPGIDIGVPYSTPIKAAAAGKVIWASWLGGYGNLVVIDHGNGLATAYGHQSRIAVGNGAQVAQGQVIGYVGCTGYCFGPHLHFEVRLNGAPVNPVPYLP